MSTVESRSGAVAYRAGGAQDERRLSLPLSPRSPSLRFPSPLIELDVTISVIQLSDGFHMEACAAVIARTRRTRTRPAPQRRGLLETAGSHRLSLCDGGKESDERFGTDTAGPRFAPSIPTRR